MAETRQKDPFATKGDGKHVSSQPLLHQEGAEVQRYGEMRLLPIALAHDARMESSQLLNQINADTIIL